MSIASCCYVNHVIMLRAGIVQSIQQLAIDSLGTESQWQQYFPHWPIPAHTGPYWPTPAHTGPRTHSASCIIGTESLSQKKDTQGVASTTHSATKVKERVEQCLYSPFQACMACSRVYFTLQHNVLQTMSYHAAAVSTYSILVNMPEEIHIFHKLCTSYWQFSY
jgi:hypothetical protein